jgi:hypothetical protein
MFENRIGQVADVVDHYEALHLSSQSRVEIRAAIETLHSQNLVLMHATDEEQLVEEKEQVELQKVYVRLFAVITIYEDYISSLPDSQSMHSLLGKDDDKSSEPEHVSESRELPKLLQKITIEK